MSKHTPGPWGIEHRHGEINIISCNERDADEFRLGVVYVLARNIGGMIHGENFDDRSEVGANARLIAAAPELLEFVSEWLERQGDDNNYMTSKARAAIAKATGGQQ